MKKATKKVLTDPKKRMKGSVLLLLIVLIVVIAVIGVGIMSMFSSSMFSIFSSNSARRAQYLAESGIRYVLSEIRHASPSLKESTLANMDDGSGNDKWFKVTQNVESFNIRVYPLFSNTTTGTGVATNTITAVIANSGFPPAYSIPGIGTTARLHVGPSNPVTISSVSGAAAGSRSVTYILSSPVTIPNGTIQKVLLSFPTTNTSQTVTKNSDATPLTLNINSASAIAKKNGAFMDVTAGKLYTYRTAKVVGVNVQLGGINWNTTNTTVVFPPNRYLSFSPAIRIDAKGKHNQAEKTFTDYMILYTLTSQMSPPGNLTPPALTPAASGITNDLSAFDLAQSAGKVSIQGYVTIYGTHFYWLGFRNLGIVSNKVPDPENTSCEIAYHVLPISDALSDNLRNIWMQYNQLNYDVQIKMGWDYNLEYAVQGVTFRWHESETYPGKFEGYGLSFLRFSSKTQCTNDPDLIPNSIKPGTGNALKDKLLLVFWQQKVIASGIEAKDWLAYAELGDPSNLCIPPNLRNPLDADQKVTGNQYMFDGKINDDAGIVVRVEDKFINSVRYNEIKLFYTDSSQYNFQNDSRSRDSTATNKQRARYYPKWLEISDGGTLPDINPKWPSNRLDLNGSAVAYWQNSLTSYDYFTLTSATQTTTYSPPVKLITNSSSKAGFNTWQLLTDGVTIRTTDYLLDSFPQGRKEIGLSAMADLRPPVTVAFDDFYIQILGGY